MQLETLQVIHVNSSIMEGFYFVAAVKKWDDKTYESYHSDFKILERYIKERGIQPVLSQLSEKLIREFLFDMGKGKASATVRRYHGTLSRVFKRLERENIRSVMIDIELPPLHHHPGRYLTYEECADILLFSDELLELEKKDVSMTIRYMLYSGLRNDTLQKCKVGYLDLQQGILHIPAEISKRSEPQQLPLPTKLLEKTELYIKTYQLKAEDGLLPGLSGKALFCRQLNRITDRLNDYFGWKNEKKVTPHVFRATLSTLLDDMQVNGDVIDFILNHHPQNVREKHYSRSTARKIRETKIALDTFESKIEALYERKKCGSMTSIVPEKQPTIKHENQMAEPNPSFQQVMLKTIMEMMASNPQMLVEFMQNQEKKK